MRLSNLADYAVVTMSQAARHCGGGRTSAAELAEAKQAIQAMRLPIMEVPTRRFRPGEGRRADLRARVVVTLAGDGQQSTDFESTPGPARGRRLNSPWDVDLAHGVLFIAMAGARRWSLPRTLAITAACGVGHVLGSLVLGAAGIDEGLHGG